ncbi:MAG: prepilin-type N-terminal cleavage/methylation domain-containing protein [Synergistetes bacterium]|nr:prepilin-type N-terminal cleavage/methylation domain-containing protein [Synergistota bacterium]
MKKGLSLVELLITMVVITIGIFALYSAFYGALLSGERLSSRFVMLKLAQGKLDELIYGVSGADFPQPLPTQVVFSGSETNLARIPSYLSPGFHNNVYNGISYCCMVDLSTPSTGALLIKVRVWEHDRPKRFIELVGVRPE